MLYKVLSNLKINGRTRIAGVEIDIDEKDGKSLVEDGVLETVKVVKPKEPEKKVKKKK